MQLFAHAARRLAGIAGAHLGWLPHDFWGATPAELATIFEALAGGGAELPPGADTMKRLQEQFPDG